MFNTQVLHSQMLSTLPSRELKSWRGLTWRHMRRAGHVNSPPRMVMQYPSDVRMPDPGSDLVRRMEKKTIPSAVSKHKAVM